MFLDTLIQVAEHDRQKRGSGTEDSTLLQSVVKSLGKKRSRDSDDEELGGALKRAHLAAQPTAFWYEVPDRKEQHEAILKFSLSGADSSSEERESGRLSFDDEVALCDDMRSASLDDAEQPKDAKGKTAESSSGGDSVDDEPDQFFRLNALKHTEDEQCRPISCAELNKQLTKDDDCFVNRDAASIMKKVSAMRSAAATFVIIDDFLEEKRIESVVSRMDLFADSAVMTNFIQQEDHLRQMFMHFSADARSFEFLVEFKHFLTVWMTQLPKGTVPHRTEWKVFCPQWFSVRIVDCVAKTPDGRYIIIDWKSGETGRIKSRNMTPDQIKGTIVEQLNIYQFLLHRHYGINAIARLAVYLLPYCFYVDAHRNERFMQVTSATRLRRHRETPFSTRRVDPKPQAQIRQKLSKYMSPDRKRAKKELAVMNGTEKPTFSPKPRVVWAPEDAYVGALPWMNPRDQEILHRLHPRIARRESARIRERNERRKEDLQKRLVAMDIEAMGEKKSQAESEAESTMDENPQTKLTDDEASPVCSVSTRQPSVCSSVRDDYVETDSI